MTDEQIDDYIKKQQNSINDMAKSHPELMIEFTSNMILTSALKHAIYTITGRCSFVPFTNVYHLWEKYNVYIGMKLFGVLQFDELKDKFSDKIRSDIFDILTDTCTNMLNTEAGLSRLIEYYNSERSTIVANLSEDILENLVYWFTALIVHNSNQDFLDEYKSIELNESVIELLSLRLQREITNVGTKLLKSEIK